ncbi:transcription factor A, mitochondrial-like isoform X2 [Portunus trituberculatus]|uniref:transcription factor A, mitochondrial-like isoform X2 n=1 Tax=Portunus trituberculatus TaxID=210409 RepID=UPI001E1CB193|nr:transcription factor A, mitochondrial-like isoform X2 [Portunus trituberculatus]
MCSLCSPSSKYVRLVCSAGKKTLQQEPELPKMPKKPLSPYIQFRVKNLDDIQRNNPYLTAKEVENKVLEMWQGLSFEEKNLHSLEYEKKKTEYATQYKEFAEKLDALTVNQTSDSRGKRKGKLKLKPEEVYSVMKKKLIKETENIAKKEDCDSLGKPKIPKNSFTVYLNSLNQDGIKFKNFHEGSIMWKELPEEEKEIFRQKARVLQEQYQAALLVWETKMWEMGRYDLVRREQRTRLRRRQRLKGS